jgi:hypothetical protein
MLRRGTGIPNPNSSIRLQGVILRNGRETLGVEGMHRFRKGSRTFMRLPYNVSWCSVGYRAA